VSETVDTLEKKPDGNEKVGVGEFIKQTREELDKVSFPSSEDVRGTTIIVVANVIFFAIFLFLVDQGWVYVFQAIEWVVNKLAGL
jgi:preprotein translocase SecE subunit